MSEERTFKYLPWYLPCPSHAAILTDSCKYRFRVSSTNMNVLFAICIPIHEHMTFWLPQMFDQSAYQTLNFLPLQSFLVRDGSRLLCSTGKMGICHHEIKDPGLQSEEWADVGWGWSEMQSCWQKKPWESQVCCCCSCWGEAVLGDALPAVAAKPHAPCSLGGHRSQGFSGLSHQDHDHALA